MAGDPCRSSTCHCTLSSLLLVTWPSLSLSLCPWVPVSSCDLLIRTPITGFRARPTPAGSHLRSIVSAKIPVPNKATIPKSLGVRTLTHLFFREGRTQFEPHSFYQLAPSLSGLERTISTLSSQPGRAPNIPLCSLQHAVCPLSPEPQIFLLSPQPRGPGPLQRRLGSMLRKSCVGEEA